jgi:hypothetical protein
MYHAVKPDQQLGTRNQIAYGLIIRTACNCMACSYTDSVSRGETGSIVLVNGSHRVVTLHKANCNYTLHTA